MSKAKSASKRTVNRREQILCGAGAALRQHKGGVLRMQQVAEQLGLVKGNIYHYFKDRQDLIYHCHLRCVEMSLEALDAVLAVKASAEQRLRDLLVRHIEIIVGSDYGGALLADMGEMKPAQRRRYIAVRDRFEAGVRKLIGEGVSKGEFRPINVRLSGFSILGSINWIPRWYRADGPLKPRAIAEWFADFYIQALKR